MASDERAAVPERILFQCPWAKSADFYLPLEVIRAALAAQGLHVVSDADMRVLEACKSWAVEFISYPDGTGVTQYGDVMSIARAELARREALK